MSVTTPATGQKISDFSAGNVDANTYLIQANNGNTTKVTATQIGEYSNLNLLFNGAGGLDTTAKTIVGAINEVNGKDLGDIDDVTLTSPTDGNVLAYDSNSGEWYNFDLGNGDSASTASSNPITCPNSTYTKCVQITLDKGFYIFLGMLAFDDNITGVRGINISTTSGDSGIAATRLTVNACQSGQTRFQTFNLASVSSDNTTYYLNAYQTSGGNLNVVYSRLIAVKIRK